MKKNTDPRQRRRELNEALAAAAHQLMKAFKARFDIEMATRFISLTIVFVPAIAMAVAQTCRHIAN